MKFTVERGLVFALCVAIGGFFVWTARSNGDPWWFGLEQRDYYNLLIDGYLDGQLNMKVDVPAELLRLKDPYDPELRRPGLGLHDASFYHGKYYVYFGAAPMILLMLPFRIVTGMDLPLAAAVIVFAYGGFLASVAVLLGVRRRYFAATKTWVVLLTVMMLGFAALWPVLVRRPQMWELPIGAGTCFAMLALLCTWRSLHEGDLRGRSRWFAGVGVCLGLAIASRPTYLIASPFLAVPLFHWWRGERRVPWRELISVTVPLAVVGLLMAWHNFARFGNPLQFGQAYQFSLDYESKMAHFRATYVPFNLWRYFFSAARWSAEYPFIAPAELPPKPPGFAGHDDVYGVLRNLPIAWLAFAAPLAWWQRARAEQAILRAWVLMVAVLFALMAGVLLCFFGSLARYQIDFTPALMLLAGVGVLAVERWLSLRGAAGVRWAVRVTWITAAVVSVLFGALFSVQLNRFMRHRSPANDRAVARVLNRIPAWAGSVLGRPRQTETAKKKPSLPGAGSVLRLRVQFPAGRTGTREPLLTTGRAGEGDVLWVAYLDARSVCFGFDHWGAPGVTSQPITVDFAQPVNLEIVLSSLLMPADPVVERPVKSGRLFMKCDGAIVWAREIEYYSAEADEVVVGQNPIGATSCVPAFTGTILSAVRTPK